MLDEDFLLANEVKVPMIGFGTWQIPEGRAAYDSVSAALQSGYRHIDTALAYANEKSVGKAVRGSGVGRGRVFVTSKLPAEVKTYEGAHACFEETMKNLDLEYLDLYLIHAPWPWENMGQDCTAGNILAWKAMEEIYESGRCRAIGVSNFSVSDMTAVMEAGKVKPMVNQIRFFIGHTQEPVTHFCRENGILVEAYSPLATGTILGNKETAALAGKYHVSVPQICIRYVLQKGALPLPKSTHADRILQNTDVDFQISEGDMDYLDSLRNTVRK